MRLITLAVLIVSAVLSQPAFADICSINPNDPHFIRVLQTEQNTHKFEFCRKDHPQRECASIGEKNEGYTLSELSSIRQSEYTKALSILAIAVIGIILIVLSLGGRGTSNIQKILQASLAKRAITVLCGVTLSGISWDTAADMTGVNFSDVKGVVTYDLSPVSYTQAGTLVGQGMMKSSKECFWIPKDHSILQTAAWIDQHLNVEVPSVENAVSFAFAHYFDAPNTIVAVAENTERDVANEQVSAELEVSAQVDENAALAASATFGGQSR